MPAGAARVGRPATIAACGKFLFALTSASNDDTGRVVVAIARPPGTLEQKIPQGPILAASVVMTVPPVILVLAFQRKIEAGLIAGGVKG